MASKIGTAGNRSGTIGMPSFISQMPVSNPMGTEANNTNTSRMSDFGVLEQYLGFRIGDGANVNRSPLFNSTTATNPAVGFEVSGTINRTLAPLNTSLPTATPGSQTMQLQSNLVSVSGTHHENWGESNMADSGSRTDTSTDMDGDDKNQLIEAGQSSDKSKEKVLDQKTLRRLAQNREAARKSRLRKKSICSTVGEQPAEAIAVGAGPSESTSTGEVHFKHSRSIKWSGCQWALSI